MWVKKDREKVLDVPEKRFPCKLWRRPLRDRLSACSPWRQVVEQVSNCSHGRTPHQIRWMWSPGWMRGDIAWCR